MKKISSQLPGYRYALTAEVLSLIEGEKLPPVFLCIGTNRLTGDRLGPAVGHILSKRFNARAFVYGTLERPITAANIISVHDFIRRNHEGKIFAIDAALGSAEEKGMIHVYRGGLKPAAALDRDFPEIGDYSLTVNVNALCAQNIVALASVRERQINELAENIALAISDALTLHRACIRVRSIA